MQESRARLLLKKYREGTLSKEERSLLESWYLELARSKGLNAGKEELGLYLDSMDEMTPEVSNTAKGRSGSLLKWTSVAASILIVLSFGGYWFFAQEEEPGPAHIVTLPDASPGGDRAMLTLASGESIFLDKAPSGKLAQEGRMSIVKTREGEIEYGFVETAGKGFGPMAFNRIETPKAGQYRVILPDGTRAWLNAASSIRFPTVFAVDERVVELTGEVYLEVAKQVKGNKPVPFRVHAGGQTIEVLGTAFNVNCYTDEEAIRTTLLEGSIQIEMKNASGKNIILKPGQQAQFVPELNNKISPGSKIKVMEVDIGAAVAWKEGYFRFDGIDLPELMRQLSRWYDMEVVYEGPVGEYEFVGQIERNTRLSKVLQILEIGGVQFRIEENKIIVVG